MEPGEPGSESILQRKDIFDGREKYTLRDLTAADVFPMFKIVSSIGVKEFKNAFEADDVKAMTGTKNKPSAASVGITIAVNIADVVFSNLPRCEDDIYRFLSGLSGMSTKEIAALPMDVFMDMVVDTIKKEEFKNFLGLLQGCSNRGYPLH